jgi:hypothetical protein
MHDADGDYAAGHGFSYYSPYNWVYYGDPAGNGYGYGAPVQPRVNPSGDYYVTWDYPYDLIVRQRPSLWRRLVDWLKRKIR